MQSDSGLLGGGLVQLFGLIQKQEERSSDFSGSRTHTHGHHKTLAAWPWEDQAEEWNVIPMAVSLSHAAWGSVMCLSTAVTQTDGHTDLALKPSPTASSCLTLAGVCSTSQSFHFCKTRMVNLPRGGHEAHVRMCQWHVAEVVGQGSPPSDVS